MLKTLRFMRESSWPEVFATWKAQEGAMPSWQEFARREKGWDSWEQWRRHFAHQWQLEESTWQIYEIDEPNETIPQFLMGPFKTWQQHFDQQFVHSFRDLVVTAHNWVAQNTGIAAHLANFPAETQLIGIYLPWLDKVMILEGHHRSAAVALGVTVGRPIKFVNPPLIAIAVITEHDFERFKELITFDSRHPRLIQSSS